MAVLIASPIGNPGLKSAPAELDAGQLLPLFRNLSFGNKFRMAWHCCNSYCISDLYDALYAVKTRGTQDGRRGGLCGDGGVFVHHKNANGWEWEKNSFAKCHWIS